MNRDINCFQICFSFAARGHFLNKIYLFMLVMISKLSNMGTLLLVTFNDHDLRNTHRFVFLWSWLVKVPNIFVTGIIFSERAKIFDYLDFSIDQRREVDFVEIGEFKYLIFRYRYMNIKTVNVNVPLPKKLLPNSFFYLGIILNRICGKNTIYSFIRISQDRNNLPTCSCHWFV